ncbi:MAG TPA: hypothetical protein VGD78_04990 [Chthoniobacterales bacterium]
MDTDEEQRSSATAASACLKEAGFLQNPQTFVRGFSMVDVGGTRPTAIMDLETGEWANFTAPFEGAVPELQGNSERDDQLRDSIKYGSYSRQHPDD